MERLEDKGVRELLEIENRSQDGKIELLLGKCYHLSLNGTSQNLDEAVTWYEKAASHNEYEAMIALGYIYMQDFASGDVEAEDKIEMLDRAFSYFNMACFTDREDSRGWYGLSRCFDIAGKYKREVECLEAALEKNPHDLCAVEDLGICLFTGKGTRKDFGRAVFLLKQAVEDGSENDIVYYMLGIAFGEGLGEERNPSKSFFYFHRAYEMAPFAFYNQHAFGRCFLYGNGTDVDLLRAKKYLELSLKDPRSNAAEDLRLCLEMLSSLRN